MKKGALDSAPFFLSAFHVLKKSRKCGIIQNSWEWSFPKRICREKYRPYPGEVVCKNLHER